jgi:hypothetical protein
MAGLPSVGQNASQVFTPHFHQRLPHPLSHLLKELPVVDGTDVNLLYDFLLKVIKICLVGQMKESTIYEIMYPFFRGELLTFVTYAVAGERGENTFTPCRSIISLLCSYVQG